MIYVVLGMHKSGTTLVAQLLHQSGVNMGFDLLDGEESYEREKCEGHLLREINRSLLKSDGLHSLDIEVKKSLFVSEEVESLTRHLIEAQGAYKHWGMKDPRLTLTYEYWKDRLPLHKLIVVYREPAAVVRHYLNAKRSKFGWFKQIMFILKVLSVWKVYNSKLKVFIQRKVTDEVLVLNYDRLLDAGNLEFSELEKFTQRQLRDCRYKSRKSPGKFLAIVEQSIPILVKVTGASRLYRQLEAR